MLKKWAEKQRRAKEFRKWKPPGGCGSGLYSARDEADELPP